MWIKNITFNEYKTLSMFTYKATPNNGTKVAYFKRTFWKQLLTMAQKWRILNDSHNLLEIYLQEVQLSLISHGRFEMEVPPTLYRNMAMFNECILLTQVGISYNMAMSWQPVSKDKMEHRRKLTRKQINQSIVFISKQNVNK